MHVPLWLFGKAGYSFADVWTVVHLAFWVFVASLWWAREQAIRGRELRWAAYLGGVSCSYLWEVAESHLAPRYPAIWLHHESWWNSWISDPLTCVLGFMITCWMLDRWAR